jgi:single-strand DNA-binding protein
MPLLCSTRKNHSLSALLNLHVAPDSIGLGSNDDRGDGGRKIFRGGKKMAGVNKAILVGRLGTDPVKRYTSSGTPVVTYRMATSENWTNKEGQREERTEWHRIVAWGKLAEICDQYLSKGRMVYVEGRIQTREWEDRDGNRRWTTEIVCNQMQMLGPASGERSESSEAGEEPPPFDTLESDDDIPF